MKIRNGFVSNSSSSSFVLMVEKGAHDQAIDRMKEHEHFEVLKEITDGMEKNKKKFLGRDLVVYESSDCHGECWMTGIGSSDNLDNLDYERWAITNEDGDEESCWQTWSRVVDGVFNEYCSHISDDMCIVHSQDM